MSNQSIAEKRAAILRASLPPGWALGWSETPAGFSAWVGPSGLPKKYLVSGGNLEVVLANLDAMLRKLGAGK